MSGKIRRFKRYPKYKDSGVEWLGEIPAHWQMSKMWGVTTATSGGTPAKEEARYWDGDVPWISPKDMKRRFIDSSEDTVTRVALSEVGLKLVKEHSVLIVVRGMILAHSFPVAITQVPVTINQDIKALRIRRDVDPEFFSYWLTGAAPNLLELIVDEAAHGTKAIRMDRWRVTPVTLPPLAEQQPITGFLDRETAGIDVLVAKNERLIELLHERRSALITRAVTKGLDPYVPMDNSRVDSVGDIPAHWSVRKVTWLFSIGSGTTPPSENDQYYGGEIPWITTSELRENVVHSTEKTVTTEALRTLSSLKLHPRGSVAVAMYGATIGRLGILGMDATVNQACCVFSRPRGIDTYFWFYWLQMRRSHLVSLGYGGGQPNLSQELLRSIRMPVPPLEEQRAIVRAIESQVAGIDDLIAKIQVAISALHEFRTALISAAVTGKIDVREEFA